MCQLYWYVRLVENGVVFQEGIQGKDYNYYIAEHLATVILM